MKVQILSDLHNEFHRARNVPVPDIEDAGADLIILAGDIDVGLEGVRWAIEQSERLNRTMSMFAETTNFTSGGPRNYSLPCVGWLREPRCIFSKASPSSLRAFACSGQPCGRTFGHWGSGVRLNAWAPLPKA